MEQPIVITKRLCKQGNQVLLVVPMSLKNLLPAGTLAKITIEKLE